MWSGCAIATAWTPKDFAPEFFQALESYTWPGNIRELVNAIDSTLAVSGQDPKLYHTHLPTNIRVHMARNSVCKDTVHDDDMQ